MKDLRQRTIRGSLAKLLSQGANVSIRVATLVILARLLDPKDFGIVGMATAFTGLLNLFRDFGLSAAALQQPRVTNEQISTLFWVNMLFGMMLTLLTLALAPAVAAFYHRPGLEAVTAVLGLSFFFNSAGTQHLVLLQRQMRFVTLSVIGFVSLILSTAIAIGGAMAGFGYWALVSIPVMLPLIATVGFWLTAGWIPGMPHRNVGLRSMIRFGGTLTVSGLIAYVGYNLDKVLLGRFWGADALGIYGRSYQILNMPTNNLNVAAGEVGFAALSRLQDDRSRFRNYFLKGFSLVLALTIPFTIACALFPGDVIFVALGPKWSAAAPILRFLAPTILVLAIVNPLGWLMCSLGLVGRCLKIALVMAPLAIIGYFVGLPYGPRGVACGYSVVMLFLALPLAAWSVHGTAVSFRDVLLTLSRPLASGVVAGTLAFALSQACGHLLAPLPRLLMETGVLFLTYAALLLFVGGQKVLYLELWHGLKGSSSLEKETLASA